MMLDAVSGKEKVEWSKLGAFTHPVFVPVPVSMFVHIRFSFR
jgi:hypothetical protein